MSDATILLIGAIIFGVLSLLVLQFGYATFGAWYDRDKAEEVQRRQRLNDAARAAGVAMPERAANRISHDRPDDLAKMDLTGSDRPDPEPVAT